MTFQWTLGFKGLRKSLTPSKKCPYSEFFWSVFFRIYTEYEDLLFKYPYSVRMRENTDQKNSQYGHFPVIVICVWYVLKSLTRVG